MDREQRRKKAKRARIFRRVVLALLLIGILFLGYLGVRFVMDKVMGTPKDAKIEETETETETPETETEAPQTEAPVETEAPETEEQTEAPGEEISSVKVDDLKSANAILIRLSDGEVLMTQEAEEKTYPASITKVMTALVAIENIDDLNEQLTVKDETVQRFTEEGASQAGFAGGEVVRAEDLIYGAILPSGAECCVTLAEHVSGSEEDFVTKMNEKAAELGMENTHFTNTVGLHDDDHYSTARDLSKMLQAALENETFRSVFTTDRWTAEGSITFESSVFANAPEDPITDGELLGGKTGFTSDAGMCLASLAKVGDTEYILITTGAEGELFGEQHHINDAIKVYNAINGDDSSSDDSSTEDQEEDGAEDNGDSSEE